MFFAIDSTQYQNNVSSSDYSEQDLEALQRQYAKEDVVARTIIGLLFLQGLDRSTEEGRATLLTALTSDDPALDVPESLRVLSELPDNVQFNFSGKQKSKAETQTFLQIFANIDRDATIQQLKAQQPSSPSDEEKAARFMDALQALLTLLTELEPGNQPKNASPETTTTPPTTPPVPAFTLGDVDDSMEALWAAMTNIKREVLKQMVDFLMENINGLQQELATNGANRIEQMEKMLAERMKPKSGGIFGFLKKIFLSFSPVGQIVKAAGGEKLIDDIIQKIEETPWLKTALSVITAITAVVIAVMTMGAGTPLVVAAVAGAVYSIIDATGEVLSTATGKDLRLSRAIKEVAMAAGASEKTAGWIAMGITTALSIAAAISTGAAASQLGSMAVKMMQAVQGLASGIVSVNEGLNTIDEGQRQKRIAKIEALLLEFQAELEKLQKASDEEREDVEKFSQRLMTAITQLAEGLKTLNDTTMNIANAK